MRFRFLLLPLVALALATGCSRKGEPLPDCPFAWAPVPYGTPQLTSFSKVAFASGQVGWIIGGYEPDQITSSTVLRTQDGGVSWARVNLHPLTLNGFRTLAPVNEQVVFAVGVDPAASAPTSPGPQGPANGRAVYRSTDGGATWQKQAGTGFEDSFELHFLDEQTGLSFKNQRIQRTTDGGASWRTVFNAPAGNWDRVQFPTAAVGYAAGGSVSGGIAGGVFSSGSLAKTDDGGLTWRLLPWGHQYISTLSFVSPTVGFVATYPDHDLYKTRDGGATWQLVNANLPASGNGRFLSEMEGFLTTGQTILHTHDGGLSWQEVYRVTPASRYPATINSLLFPTGAIGLAVTADGQIIRATR